MLPVNCPSSDACSRVFGSGRFTPRGPPVRFNAIILFLSTDHASLCAWLLCISQKSKRLRDQSTFTSDAIFAETLIFWHLVGNLVSLASLLHKVCFQMLSNLRLHISATFETLSSMKFHQKSEPSNTFDQFQPSLNTGASCSSRTMWRHVCVSCCIHDLMDLLDDGMAVGEEISLFHRIHSKISHIVAWVHRSGTGMKMSIMSFITLRFLCCAHVFFQTSKCESCAAAHWCSRGDISGVWSRNGWFLCASNHIARTSKPAKNLTARMQKEPLS